MTSDPAKVVVDVLIENVERVARGERTAALEVEREADALTDHLLASPFSPFRPRPPGTYR